jgi:hypothetical protein
MRVLFVLCATFILYGITGYVVNVKGDLVLYTSPVSVAITTLVYVLLIFAYVKMWQKCYMINKG